MTKRDVSKEASKAVAAHTRALDMDAEVLDAAREHVRKANAAAAAFAEFRRSIGRVLAGEGSEEKIELRKMQEGRKGRETALKFTGQPKPERIDFKLSHPTGYLDEDLSEAVADALRTLAIAIGEARTRDISGEGDEERAVREALLGFGILAFNEARAFLIVAGAGLDRHARIHYRAVMEYELRVKRILEDAGCAKALFDAFAHEFRKFTRDLELTDQNAVDAEIEATMGVPADELETGPEKRALFGKSGDVKSAMNDLPNGNRRYVGTFSWPSQVSHGSIMALREVAKSTAGAGSNFLDLAGRDGYGDRLAYSIIWTIMHFANHIAIRFDFGLLAHVEPVVRRAIAANHRLDIISEEQEERAKTLLAEARQKAAG